MFGSSLLDNKLKKYDNEDLKIITSIREELSNYNMVDFLEKVSTLMLIPENQSKSVIFQIMISTALSLNETEFNNDNIMSYGKFKNFVSKFSNLNRKLMIDPPEFPFVLPIIYYGNYHIFMGANSLSPIYVNQMLKIFSVYCDKLNKSESEELNHLIKGLLTISEQIFNNLDINFRELKSFNKDNEIKIASSNAIRKYIESIKFNVNDIEKLLGTKYVDLIINFGDILVDEVNNFDNQKFYKKPFLKCGELVVLLDVTSFISLIMDIIIEGFIKDNNINIFDEYNKLTLINLNKDYFRMGYQELNPEPFNIILEKNENVNESLYLCGNDIVFYNLVLFDNGQEYETEKNYYINIDKTYIARRIKYISSQLKKENIKDDKIVTILTPTTLGRNMYYMLSVEKSYNLLTLGQYEINAIATNEQENSMFLYRYIRARNKLKHYHKNLFSELNIVALYSEHDNSFYLNDDFDTKDTPMFLIGEYSSDYILKSYIKESFHLAKYKNRFSLIEVMKQDDNIYFAPGLFFNKQLNNLIECNNFYIWVFSDENISPQLYSTVKLIIDMLSYWLSQFSDSLSVINGIFNISIKCDDDLSIIPYDKNIKAGEIKFSIKDNNLDICFMKNSLKYFDESGNAKEKEFICNIIKYICTYYDIYIDLDIIDEKFENCYKKKIITMSSAEDAYMLPFDDSPLIRVNSSDINLILDDAGLFLKNGLKINYGKIEDFKVLNKIVDYLYTELLKILKKYKKTQLIEILYTEFEKNLSSLLIRQSNYANDIACYPNRKKEIDDNINELNRTSVALKFLIELTSSTKFRGENNVSLYEVNYALSIASTIIDFAYTCDGYMYNMAENTLTLLDSNRIGYNRNFVNRVNKVLKIAKTEKMSSTVKDKRSQILKYKNNKKDIPGFEDAFADEFGFTFSDFTEVTVSLLDLAESKNNMLNCIFSIGIEEIKNYINNKVSDESLEKILNYFSQMEREDYLFPSAPYKKYDVYPWRNNRELSLNRKPLIQYDNKIIYGYRTLINSVYFLFEIINNGSLKTRSSKMKKYISEISRERGNDFNELVFNYLSSYKELIVDKKVNKINGKKIMDNNNQVLGDIDVLFISKKKKRIAICETKNFELSRNMYELHFEYMDMFEPNNEKSFYNKHMKRVKWCKENIDNIKIQYNLPDIKWKIDYCFIVNEPLVSNKAMKANVRAYTIEEIDKFI